MVRTEMIPLDDLKKFMSLVRRGNITTTPEGRRIYNRLYLKVGDMKVIYNLLGLPNYGRRRSSLSVSDAERLFVEAFESGEVTQIREFVSKYQNAARVLRRKYRYLTTALKTLCPSLYIHNDRQPVPLSVVNEKLRKIVERDGYLLVTDKGKLIPVTHKGVPTPIIQSAAIFYYGSLLHAAQTLNLPYRLYLSPDEKMKTIKEIVMFVRGNPPQSIYALEKEFGVTFAARVYRLLRKLGGGDYRKGVRRILTTPDDKIDKIVKHLMKGR